jgi:formate-dependent phosphoribosylglycinamide formyltransferase (GAR transformylase)
MGQLGIPRIEWRYVPDSERSHLLDLVDRAPIMLRTSRSSGGVGLHRVESSEELISRWPEQEEAYVSVAAFHGDGIPVNVGGVVWRDGVTLHPASVQIIGIRECTARPFGYCGNDFGAASLLEDKVLEQMNESSLVVGRWLGTMGYLGAFGVDYLVVGGDALFMEVNPRFQGSSHLSSRISFERGDGCIFLEHIAAFLGMECPASNHLVEMAHQTPGWSHVVVHNTGNARCIDVTPLVGRAMEAGAIKVDLAVGPQLVVAPSGVIARLTFPGSASVDGFSLDPAIAAAITGADAPTLRIGS